MKSIPYLCLALLLFIPSKTTAGHILITCDNYYHLYVNGGYIGSSSEYDPDAGWATSETWNVPLQVGNNLIAIHGIDTSCPGRLGLIAEIHTGYGEIYVTDSSWKVTSSLEDYWVSPYFDDPAWAPSFDIGPYNTHPWNEDGMTLPEFADNGARWIWNGPLTWNGIDWVDANAEFCDSYFRKTIFLPPPVPLEQSTWGSIKALYE